ncbi:STAS domain-containing protein [Myxosarcina sp. GI1]|uniref:STAS domain-containing protein n=1 Tax=Myxosarcina sp. GI1 TaxID=1541065 RepID=UPI00055ECF36|nr:STAS domain-containing protein [Myxosarcina sp. GI1]
MNSTQLQTEFVTFQPQGYLSAANAEELSNELTVAIKTSSNSPILIDMSEVEFMDSAALVVLIKAFRWCQNSGRKLSVCSVAPSVKMIFELTQLDKLIEIFENRSSFEAARN